VFVEHTLPMLRRQAAASPQAIALADGRVVGYCLSLLPSMRDAVPVLAPMFEQFGRCTWRGRPLASHRYVVGGQVCVDRDFRGQGLLARLYDQLRVALAGSCELCVTEIATRNAVSVRAHKKMGFEAIAHYGDGRVVGYCLSLLPSLRDAVPVLAPMFEQFGRCTYRGRPLAEHRHVVGGQVCVDREFRGQGLLAGLYDQLRLALASTCELCVTEIATRNVVSVRSHERMGFEPIAHYDDGREAWVIVAWDLSRPARR
jgi:GNAT superfamily N-acetyltransferase